MAADQVLFAQAEEILVFKFLGDIRFTLCPAVDAFMKNVFSEQPDQPVLVDLTQTKTIDSTALGLLAQIAIHSRKRLNQKPGLLVSDPNVMKVLKGMSLEKVFNILQETAALPGEFREIDPITVDKKEMMARVLKAHRTLMGLSRENREKFKNVTELLEQQSAGEG